MGIIWMIQVKCLNFIGSMIYSYDSWFIPHPDKVLAGGSSQAFAPLLAGPLRRLLNQSPSAARGLRYRKWPFAKEQCFGGFGGVSPPL